VRHIPANEPCQLWICLEGEGEIGGERFGRSDVWLLPETGMQPCLQTATGAHFLRTYLPR
jgi:hypothetical protein